ncbi:MAG TPA: ABC transporter substrate-binding protein, partial [Chloroflexota bacterium]|nr:ABC transporter substrate-binding protein [Chloroflexota bacterium]
PASAAASASAQPVAGGTLRVGQVGDLTTADPSFSSGLVESVYAAHDRLTAYDLKHQPQPMLAESWDETPDDKQITFHLRKGVMFHNGREMTSDDVKFNVVRLQSGGFNGQLQGQAKWWTNITTPDKYTIVLQSDASRPAMFDFFEQVNITDPVTAQGPDAKSKVVGTGPFVFDEWVQGDHIKLSKNKNYWRSGLPYLDGVMVSILKDTQAMIAQFEAGALDIAGGTAGGTPVSDYIRLKADTSKYIGILHPDSGAVSTIGVSATKPPFDNKQVRQAFQWAIDRQRFNDTILKGTGIAGSIPWGPNSPAYDQAQDNFYKFDLDKAKSLLQQGGVTKLDIDLIVTSGNAETDAFDQVYQADLAKIGVNVNIKGMDPATWIDTVNKVKFFGVWVGGIAYTQLEPSTALLSSRGLSPTANSSGFVSDKYTSLVNQSAEEPDAAKRKDLYHQINDLMLDESFLDILSKTPSRLLTTVKVHGLAPTLHGTFIETETWLSK